MRSTLTLALLASISSLSAQIQNGGFETLGSFSLPTYWSAGIESITIGDSIVVDSAKYLLNTTDVHSGQHAAELRNSYNFTQGFGSPGVWFASPFEESYGGFQTPEVPIVERPQNVRFWAKYAPVGGDSAYAEVKVLNEFQEEIGFGALRIGGNVDTYTAFDVPVEYTSTDSTTIISVRFATMVPGGDPHLGTRMLIDDVEVDYMTTGMIEVDEQPLLLFPNPATDEVRISGLDTGPSAAARVVDATGRVILSRTVINGRLSLGELSPGTYLLLVDEAGMQHQSRLVIAR